MHGSTPITPPTPVTPAPPPLEPISDDELTALALAADPDAAVADDAVSLTTFTGPAGAGPGGAGLLPEWYMPSPSGGVPLLRGWRRRVGLLIIASFVLINAYGLCSTYGHVGFG
jgi:hypothetical protein